MTKNGDVLFDGYFANGEIRQGNGGKGLVVGTSNPLEDSDIFRKNDPTGTNPARIDPVIPVYKAGEPTFQSGSLIGESQPLYLPPIEKSNLKLSDAPLQSLNHSAEVGGSNFVAAGSNALNQVGGAGDVAYSNLKSGAESGLNSASGAVQNATNQAGTYVSEAGNNLFASASGVTNNAANAATSAWNSNPYTQKFG